MTLTSPFDLRDMEVYQALRLGDRQRARELTEARAEELRIYSRVCRGREYTYRSGALTVLPEGGQR